MIESISDPFYHEISNAEWVSSSIIFIPFNENEINIINNSTNVGVFKNVSRSFTFILTNTDDLFLYKCEDEWYYVSIFSIDGPYRYKCDQLSGLIRCLIDKY